MHFSRRHWIAGSLGLTAWQQIAQAQQHAHDAATSPTPPKIEAFDAQTAREVEALASVILPSDDGPGAREAGVIFFIDRALSTFDADQKSAYRDGMAQVQQTRAKLFPTSTSIVSLDPAQQIELVRAIESTPFFELLRTHTVLGFLGNPSYGGNRDRAGWKHIGFESAGAFQPPFGFYDAEELKRGEK